MAPLCLLLTLSGLTGCGRDIERLQSSAALISDAKAAPVLAVADGATGGGIGSGGLAATLQQVQDQLSPLSYSSELIGKVVAGLIIVSAALMIGGIGYRWYAKRRKDELKDALDIPAAG
jgi:lysozyme family protein